MSANGVIQHLRITRTKDPQTGNMLLTLSGVNFVSLKELISQARVPYDLHLPCPGSKYIGLFDQSIQVLDEGYIENKDKMEM